MINVTYMPCFLMHPMFIDFISNVIAGYNMVTKASLKKLQQRLVDVLSPRQRVLPLMVENSIKPFNSFSSECSFCCQWLEDMSRESVELPREDYTVESEVNAGDEILPCYTNYKTDYSNQMSEDSLSKDGYLDMSRLSSIPGARPDCRSNEVTSPLNSTRHDDCVHSGIADITCSDHTTSTPPSSNLFNALPRDVCVAAPPKNDVIVASEYTGTYSRGEDRERVREESSPSQRGRPLLERRSNSGRPICDGRESRQVYHEAVLADGVSKIMTNARKQQIKKSLKRVGRMMRDGHQNRLRTLAVLWLRHCYSETFIISFNLLLRDFRWWYFNVYIYFIRWQNRHHLAYLTCYVIGHIQ